jgi:hypothetical protein
LTIEDLTMKPIATLMAAALLLALGAVQAKLPAPSDEAKAKAADAAAKTAWSNKTADFQLCRAQERVAARFHAEATKSGRAVNAPTATPACADPGPFVAVAAAGAAPASAPVPAASAVKKT